MKYKLTKVILIILAVSVLIGCERGKSEWQKAKSENTISAYEEFLKLYPKGKFAEEARSRLKEFYLEGYKTIKLLVF